MKVARCIEDSEHGMFVTTEPGRQESQDMHYNYVVSGFLGSKRVAKLEVGSFSTCTLF